MEKKHKKVLTRTMDDFAKSLNPSDIIPYLLSKEIISDNDYEYLAGLKTRQERVLSFISLLQCKGPSAYPHFLEALRQHTVYDHLVSKLGDLLTEHEQGKIENKDALEWSPMSVFQKNALEECSKSLTDELPFEEVCNYFLRKGLLEDSDIKFLRNLRGEANQRSVLLGCIKGKGVVAYNLLLSFLNHFQPKLSKMVLDAEERLKRKKEKFRKLITFTVTHDEIGEYSGIPRKINVILVGKTGTGKSATGNTIIGRDAFLEVSGMSSGTKTVQKEITIVNDFEFNVLDTPGLFDTSSTLKNEHIILEFMKTAEEFAEGIHVFLFVCRSESRFTEEEMATFLEIEKHLGDDMFKHCLIVLTHAEALVESTSFQNEIVSNSNLHTIFQKVFKRAIAIENNQTNGRNDQRDHLLRAVIDLISHNNGQAYSNSIFKATQKELEKQKRKKQIQEKIDDYTLHFLINEFPFENASELTLKNSIAKLSDRDVNVIVQYLRDEQLSLFTKAEIKILVQTYFKDHEEYVKNLQKYKTTDQTLIEFIKMEGNLKTCKPESILGYVVEYLKHMPDATLGKLKAGEKLSKHEIEQVQNDSPFQGSTKIKQQQSDLITKYMEMIANAFSRRRQRRDLVNCIDINCSAVIKEYFRMKTFEERSYIHTYFISKGCIPSDLHCKCLRVISSKFKTGHWDTIIGKVLLQRVQSRINTEDSIMQSMFNALKIFGAIISFIFLLPHSLLITILSSAHSSVMMSPDAFGPIAFITCVPRAIIGIFPLNCDKCGGRHKRGRFMPL